MTTNPFYEPKPTAKKPRRSPTEATPEPRAKVMPNAAKPNKATLTPEERKERRRQKIAERRQRRKELCLCRECPQPAKPGGTRCNDCAEKNNRSSDRARPPP